VPHTKCVHTRTHTYTQTHSHTSLCCRCPLQDLILSHISARTNPPQPLLPRIRSNHASTTAAPLQQLGKESSTSSTLASAVPPAVVATPSAAAALPADWWATLHMLRVHPPLCQAPGASVSSSCLLRGVLLRQGVASRHMELPAVGYVKGRVLVHGDCS